MFHASIIGGEGDAPSRSACAPSRSERVCSRHEAIELSQLCAARPDLSRVMLRMWRAFVFPTLCQECGFVWAVSYQDAPIHAGNLYRFDGWVLPATSQRRRSALRQERPP